MDNEEERAWLGLDARLERMEHIVKELDEVLRGDRRHKAAGLIALQDRMEGELSKLNAVVFMDSTGSHGIAHDVDVLMGRRHSKDEIRGLKWHFWGMILAALIGALAGILPNLDRIKKALLRVDPLEKRIEQAKHPKSRKKLLHYHVVNTSLAPGNETEPKTPPKTPPPPD